MDAGFCWTPQAWLDPDLVTNLATAPSHHLPLFCRCRFLREKDRACNEYPHLHYPELYILKGGYREFFPQYQVSSPHPCPLCGICPLCGRGIPGRRARAGRGGRKYPLPSPNLALRGGGEGSGSEHPP